MERIRRVRVDTNDEQDLLTGLITSTEFGRRVLPMLKPEHVEDSGGRKLVEWIRDYHNRYKTAPGREIQSIFKVEEKDLGESEAANLEHLLKALSDRIDPDTSYNWEFHADRARDYIRARSLDLLGEQVKVLRGRGDLDRAEQQVREYGVVVATTSEVVFPLSDKEFQRQVLEKADKGDFRMDGAVGELFGWWNFGWLIAFIGPPKRGKTWWLAEVAEQALIWGFKVLFVSLEMSKKEMGLRFMRMIASLPDEAGEHVIPVWDCVKNQDNSCQLKVRKNDELLPHDIDDLPKFDPDHPYRPCTVCKEDPELLSNYRVCSWFEKKDKWHHSFLEKAIERLAAFAKQYQAQNLALKCYARFSSGVDDIEMLMDELEQTRGFIPNMVVVDYAGILKEEVRGNTADWQVHDETWKKLARLAGERGVIMVTAGQGNAKAMHTKSMRQDQVAGYTGISGHVDVAMSLNQLNEDSTGSRVSEREQMIMRLGALAMRHGKHPTDEVFVLQDLDLGQPAMDSFAASAGHKLLRTDVGRDEY